MSPRSRSTSQTSTDSGRSGGRYVKGAAPEPCSGGRRQNPVRAPVANLISNGIKYTPERGTISVAVECRNKDALLLVRDTGVESRRRTCRIYSTASTGFPARTRPLSRGSDLGPSFVAGIVHAHGGKIDVDSTPGKSMMFCVTLRRTEAARAGRGPSEGSGEKETPHSRMSRGAGTKGPGARLRF